MFCFKNYGYPFYKYTFISAWMQKWQAEFDNQHIRYRVHTDWHRKLQRR